MLKRLAERGETIDACIVGEPTSSKRFGDMMKIGRRGSMTVDLTVHGIQGHVAYPERLDNAIHRLSAIIEALVREPIDKGSTHFQPTSLQFTTVDVGNKATNIAPGVAKARFNTRFNDLWTSKALLAHLQERIERAMAAVGGNGTVEYKVEVSGESFYTPPGPLSELVAGAVRDVAGVECELSTTGGTSDARSSVPIVRCWSSVWSARPCTRSTRRAPSPISRPWRASTRRCSTVISRPEATMLSGAKSPAACRARQVPAARSSGAAAFRQHDRSCLRSFQVMIAGGAALRALSLCPLCALTPPPTTGRSLVEALRYVVDWLLFPVIFYEIARRRGWLERYPRYIARSTGSTCRQ
jgi:hypothetical protein